MPQRRAWRVILSERADADIDAVLEWSIENFGARQAGIYQERIKAALERLASDPLQFPTRPELAHGCPGKRAASAMLMASAMGGPSVRSRQEPEARGERGAD